MKKLVFLAVAICALLSLTSFADEKEAADTYQQAHECYEQLQTSVRSMAMREPWENCIAKFAAVVKEHRRSEAAAEAQYSLGRLYEELAAYSKNLADWKRSIKEYRSFVRQYPRNSMADDAYYRMGCIENERIKDKKAAKSDLLKVIKHYKDSDSYQLADKYLKEMDAGIALNETAPKAAVPSKKGSSAGKKGIAENIVVVLDPGHGGKDTGAVGGDGTNEKDITLQLSKKLAASIKEKLPGAQVYLTRDTDKTLTLDDRVRFANKKNADYFLSIHANASKSKKEKGIQTYYLNNATDEASERLAAQENKNTGRPASDLDKIIFTMIQTDATEDSRALASRVQKNLVNGLSKKYKDIEDQNVRSALFYVLVGVKAPSVLVETSYISNPKEGKRLKTAEYQVDIANSIAEGVSAQVHASKKSNI